MAEPLNYLQWYGASAAGGAFGQLAAEVVSSGAFDTAANGLKNVAQSLQDSSVTAARAIEAWKPGVIQDLMDFGESLPGPDLQHGSGMGAFWGNVQTCYSIFRSHGRSRWRRSLSGMPRQNPMGRY